MSVLVPPLRIVPAQPDEGRQISVAMTPASAALHRFGGLVGSLAPQSWVMARHTTTGSDSACSSAEGHVDWTVQGCCSAPVQFLILSQMIMF